MESTMIIYDIEMEYDFLSAWIKYTRLKAGISQEALSHGICSISHLSYFENGKKHLRKEIIEALLKKLKIEKFQRLESIGLIRQKMNSMMTFIECFHYEEAKVIYHELLDVADMIQLSPYNIEFKIYDLMYKIFVETLDFEGMKEDVDLMDKIFLSLKDNLKYLFLLVSGYIFFRNHYNEEGIKRLEKALLLKDTSWINFLLGRSLCFHKNPARGSYYLEKALDSYEKNGRYLNAIWCHNYLGVCFSYLKIYENAKKHFDAALMSAKHFDMDRLYWHLYTNLSDLYLSKGDYEESKRWSNLALETKYSNILPAYNYVSACIKLKDIEQCNLIFEKYMTKEYEESRYYNSIYFLYLVVHKFNEECFYEEVKNRILPYYEKLMSNDICRDIKLKLIEYLESKRRYKEANQLYRELLEFSI